MFDTQKTSRCHLVLNKGEYELLLLACELVDDHSSTQSLGQVAMADLKKVKALKRRLCLHPRRLFHYQMGQSIRWSVSDGAMKLIQQLLDQSVRWSLLERLAVNKGRFDYEVDHDYAEMDRQHRVRHAKMQDYIRHYRHYCRELIDHKLGLQKKVQQRLLMLIP